MAEKYFKLEEAQELLPTIGPCLEQARDQKRQIDGLDAELAQAASRIMALGGSIPPHAELGKKRAERDRFVTKFQEAVSKITETGCLIKDLDQGLVDFPSILKGEEVYLCWKLGEEQIEFWHGIDEGFAGRKPLDNSSLDEKGSSPPRIQ